MSDVRNEEWGRRLRSAARLWADRLDVKLTPVVLANAFLKEGGRKITRQSMARWLKGREPRSLRDIQIMARLLGVSAAWLAFGEGEMRPHAERPTRDIPISGTHRDDAEDLNPPEAPPSRRQPSG